MLKVRGSISTNTGLPPARQTEFAVAAKVKEGTITSSPGRTPTAMSAMCRPDVPEFTAIQWRPLTKAENSDSKAATSGPCAIIPDCRTRSTAARSSAPTIGFAAGIITSLPQECQGRFLDSERQLLGK